MDVCCDCKAPLPSACATELCDHCIDVHCPACDSGAVETAMVAHGVGSYVCHDCGIVFHQALPLSAREEEGS